MADAPFPMIYPTIIRSKRTESSRVIEGFDDFEQRISFLKEKKRNKRIKKKKLGKVDEEKEEGT